jgi:cytoskeletal protein RodZ
MEHITTDIGSRIRQAREQRGLTIRDIANTTKISTAALNAIEHNDFARLPGGVFSRAYVRAFATEVGLDADELTREYRARVEIEICPRNRRVRFPPKVRPREFGPDLSAAVSKRTANEQSPRRCLGHRMMLKRAAAL